MKKEVIIDCDPGIDDAVALLLALGSDEFEIVAITSAGGNVPPEVSFENICRILEHLQQKRWSPIGQGLPAAAQIPGAQEIHGADGLGNSHLPLTRPLKPLNAAELILKTISESPGQISIVATAPLTNIAEALRLTAGSLAGKASVAEEIQELVIMGGAIEVPGNVSPRAEFNIFMNPDAAREVFRSGAKITLLPLDVTQKVIFTPEHLERIRQSESPAATLLSCIIPHSFKTHAQFEGIRGCYLHDALAVAAVVQPSLFKSRRLFVDVETKGELTRGMTVADLRHRSRRKPNMDVVMEVDAGGFLEFLIQRLS
jgi:purine nucleosidase